METTKNFKLSSLIVLSAVLFFASCKKESEPAPSEQEAAEILSHSITSEKGGFVTQIDNSIEIMSRHLNPANCGKVKDTALAVNYSGLAISYSYNLNWNWKLTCTSDVPTKINFSYNGTSAYSGILISSNDQVISSMEVAGLAPSEPEYIFNKQVVREGKYNSNRRGNPIYQNKTSIQSSNIKVEKNTRKIKSGDLLVNITFGRNAHQYQGQVTFNGNNTATLTLNSGRKYTIRW